MVFHGITWHCMILYVTGFLGSSMTTIYFKLQIHQIKVRLYERLIFQLSVCLSLPWDEDTDPCISTCCSILAAHLGAWWLLPNQNCQWCPGRKLWTERGVHPEDKGSLKARSKMHGWLCLYEGQRRVLFCREARGNRCLWGLHTFLASTWALLVIICAIILFWAFMPPGPRLAFSQLGLGRTSGG